MLTLVLSSVMSKSAAEKTESTQEIIQASNAEEAQRLLESNRTGWIWVNTTCTEGLAALKKTHGARVSGNVFTLSEQLELLAKIRPPVRSVIVPSMRGKQCEPQDTIIKALTPHQIAVKFVEVEQGVSSLKEIARNIEGNDALFMITGSLLYSEPKMKYWFALTIKHKVPMVGAWDDMQMVKGVALGRFPNKESKKECFSRQEKYLLEHGHWPDLPCKPETETRTNPRVLSIIGIKLDE